MKRKPKKLSKKRKGLWSKRSEYTKKDGSIVIMDSNWEVAMANRFDELDINWHRDPEMKLEYETRSGRKKNYIPDTSFKMEMLPEDQQLRMFPEYVILLFIYHSSAF